MSDGKWTASSNDEHWYCCVEWDTREDAILHAPEELGLDPGDTYYVGHKRKPELNDIDGDWAIERATGGEDFDLEWAGDAFSCTEEQRDELTQELTAAFTGWMHRHGLEPKFLVIDGATTHTFEDAQE